MCIRDRSLTLPLLVAAGTAGALVYVVQTGGMVTAGRLAPNLARLNPIAGVAGLWSRTRLFALVRALAAGVVVGWIGVRVMTHRLPDLARTAGHLGIVPLVVSEAAGTLCWRVALFGLALGVVDLVVTRSAWRCV